MTARNHMITIWVKAVLLFGIIAFAQPALSDKSTASSSAGARVSETPVPDTPSDVASEPPVGPPPGSYGNYSESHHGVMRYNGGGGGSGGAFSGGTGYGGGGGFGGGGSYGGIAYGASPALQPPNLEQVDDALLADRVHCLVRINGAQSLGISARVAEALLNSPFIKRDDKLAGLQYSVTEYGPDLFLIQASTYEPSMTLTEAAGFLRQHCEGLGQALQQIYQDTRNNLTDQLRYFAARKDRVRAKLEEYKAMERGIRSETGQFDLSYESFAKRVNALESERQSLQMNLIEVKTQRQAIEKQLAATNKKYELQEKSKNARQKLQQQVRLLEEDMDQLKVKRAQLAENMVEDHPSVKSLDTYGVELQTQLNQVRRELDGLDGNVFTERERQWNERLADLTLRQTELEARMKYLEEILAVQEDKARQLDDYDTNVRLQRDLARGKFVQAQQRLADLEEQLALIPEPHVTILAGNNEPGDQKAENP